MVEPVDREDDRDAERPEDLDVTPNFATSPMTRAPVMFSDVWIASRIIVISRIVVWSRRVQFHPNQLWVSAVT